MTGLLETQALRKTFRRGDRQVLAVDGIDFSIQKGEFVFLTGRSGSGKTTFLNLLAGFLKPNAGCVRFCGNDIAEMKDTDQSGYRNHSIGYVPQQLGALPNLTAIENVMAPAYLGEGKRSDSDRVLEQRAAGLLDLVGILKLRDAFPGSLSGGELKRVLLARALMNAPEILIADEPTADLDRETTKEIMALLRRINEKGTALLIVTHETELLSQGARVMTMSDGKLQ